MARARSGVDATEFLEGWETKFTDDDIKVLRALYAECVSNVDRRIGEFVGNLNRKGLLDHAILVITSDHGEEFYEHHGVQHEECWEELLRVPLLVRLPGAALAGSHVAQPVSGVDLLPTLLDLLGLPAPDFIEGHSKAAAMTNPREGRDHLSQHTIQDFLRGDVARTQDWKVYDFGNRVNLQRVFHLAADAAEANNLAKEPPSDAMRLLVDLKARRAVWEAMQKYYGSGDASGALDEDALRDLRNLGYTR